MGRWTDVSSYNYSDKERIPHSWKHGSGHLTSVTVHRSIHSPGRWFVTCYAINCKTVELEALDLEEAKDEGLAVVSNLLKGLVADLKADGLKGVR